jgi:hypothetical protein
MKDGGPAFPAIIPFEHSDVQGKDYPDYGESGMTLRDYFAAKAMAAFIIRSADAFESADKAAEWAYAQANAMIKERDAQPT